MENPESRIVAIIPARAGSRGIVRKNVQPLGGKPLLAYSVETALQSRYIDKVIVSTDDQEIADLAVQSGATAPFLRPKGLSGDRASIGDAVAHALGALYAAEGWRPYAVAVLYPTHPFRRVSMVDFLLSKLFEGYSQVSTVRPVPVSPFSFFAARNGGMQQLANAVSQNGSFARVCYRAYGLFEARVTGLSTLPSFFHRITDPAELIDIDYPEDLAYAERVLKAALFDFGGAVNGS